MSIDERLTDPKKPTLKPPMAKSMAPPAHATATSSPRLHLRMHLQPACRVCICAYICALHRLPCSAAHRANATSSPRLHLRPPARPLARSPARSPARLAAGSCNSSAGTIIESLDRKTLYYQILDEHSDIPREQSE